MRCFTIRPIQEIPNVGPKMILTSWTPGRAKPVEQPLTLRIYSVDIPGMSESRGTVGVYCAKGQVPTPEELDEMAGWVLRGK